MTGPGDGWQLVWGPGAPATVGLDDLTALADHHEQPVTGGRPHVRTNMVTTLDGAASAGGTSGAVSSPADRAVFSVLRAVADAILVGAGTARAENYGPAQVPDGLAAWRAARGLAPTPVVVQVTRSGRVHEGRQMFAVPGSAAVVTSSPDPDVLDRLASRAGQGHLIHAPAADGSGDVDVASMLRGLAARGWRRVLCEGGPGLLGSMLAAGAVDEMCVTTSPLVLPGEATRMVAAAAPSQRADLRLHSVAVAGSTLLTRWITA